MMKVNQLLKQNVVDTTVFNQLPPKHKEVVNDFFKVVELEDGNIIDSGTPDDLIKKYGRENLEEVFLELVRNKNEFN